MWRIFLMAAVGMTCLRAATQNISGMAAELIRQSELAREASLQRNRIPALSHIGRAQALAEEILEAAPPEPQPVLVRVYRTNEPAVSTGRLDVSSASRRLESAAKAVQNDHWVTADSDLSAIPESLIRTKVEGTMPLLEARQDLSLALIRVQERRFHAAVAPLGETAQDLAEFERLVPGPIAQDAEYFRQRIDSYASQLPRHHAYAVGEIEYFQSFIDQWCQQGIK